MSEEHRDSTKGGRSPYRLGRAFEELITRDLEKNGWLWIRSSVSRGNIDIAAWKPGVCIWIQAKRHGQFAAAEANALYRMAKVMMANGDYPIVPVMARCGKTVNQVVYYRITKERALHKEPAPY